jgi:hypothetical protein
MSDSAALRLAPFGPTMFQVKYFGRMTHLSSFIPWLSGMPTLARDSR